MKRLLQLTSLLAVIAAAFVAGNTIRPGEALRLVSSRTATAQAQQPASGAQQDGDYETDPGAIEKVITGGMPNGRWTEGLMFEGIEPQPWLKSSANWFPGTEDVQPEEIRVTFMGTTPTIRPGQMNTSVYVELGNGDSFIFDLGEGSIANYLACGIPFNKVNNIFITHLHVDHFGSLPYAYVFGAWGGRWHEPFRVYGPSGRTEEDGLIYMLEGMKMMTHWHREAFSVFPIGRGWEIEAHEFDFMDDGGVVYDQNGVQVVHWRQSHAKDGASAYRLDWNGMSVAFTGDGRPNSLTAKYAKGVDLLITEVQPEVVSISSVVQGVPPFLGRYTIDTHHNPGYAGGYLANLVQPRLYMTTHMPYDSYSNAELIAEVREHWKGPYHFGAPDGIVVNMTKDKLWVREGVIPDFPNIKPPNAEVSIAQYGGLVVPMPQYDRSEIQEPTIREAEIPPSKYYPEGYYPELLDTWPATKDLFIPEDKVPAGMRTKKNN